MTVPTSERASTEFHPSSRLALLGAGFRAQLIYLPVILVYWIAYRYLVHTVPGFGNLQFHQLLFKVLIAVLPMTLLSYIIYKFFCMVWRERPAHPLRHLIVGIFEFFSDPRRLALGLWVLVNFIVFAAIFTDIKENIPRILPFNWDMTFAEWDRILHFGRHPWQWLQPVLGFPLVSFLVNFVYNFWFFVMWIFVICMAFASSASELRTRFLSFFLTWSLGGSLLAIVFSSAGPCYFTRLGLSPDPYAELMAYLHSVAEVYPLWALDVQDTLWQSYFDSGLVAGISAMPSMHNATALLLALAGRRLGRHLGYVLWVHCVFIFLGSIHLGWHYAVDNYLGWIIALCFWWIAGPVARWWERQPHVRRLARSIELSASPQSVRSAATS